VQAIVAAPPNAVATATLTTSKPRPVAAISPLTMPGNTGKNAQVLYFTSPTASIGSLDG